MAFSFLRPRNSIVYAPKLKYADAKHAPPNIGRGLFAWVGPILRLNEADLADKIGLDATVFLRFTKMCRNLFAVITIISIGIILPTNVISNNKNKYDPNNSQDTTLSNSTTAASKIWTDTTPGYIGSKGLWVHVVCLWVINAVVAFFLWRNYIAVSLLRKRYFESPEYLMSLHSRTLMFTDVPPAMRTDEGLLRLADEVEQTGGIPRAAIARNVKELPEMIEQHDKTVRALESVLSKYLKNPDKLPPNRPTIRPSRNHRRGNGSEKVDAIDYLTDRIATLEVEIKHVRESIDKRNPMPYGFASFEKIEDAHSIARRAKKKAPQGTRIELAPRPNALIWQNLPLSKKDRSWKRFINNFWILVLTIVWIAPNALIAIFLSNLANLAGIWPLFEKNFDGHRTEWSIVQGIASPALTSLIYLVLPIVFRRLSIHAGDRTKIEREQHVTSKLYAFFVFNNLVVFSVFASLFAFVSAVIKDKDNPSNSQESTWDAIKNGRFFGKIQAGLIEVSSFWLSWLIQRNLGSAADLAQVLNLVWTWFARRFMSPTPRQWIEWSAPPTMDYAVYYNYFLFYATVTLCYVTIQPLVVPITVFFFVIDYWLKKYLLLYVLVTKNESGGQFWRLLFNRMIFATILADAIIALAVEAHGVWEHAAVIAPLPFLMLGFRFYCTRTFDDQLDFYAKVAAMDPERTMADGKKSHRTDRVASKFGNPALYKKLMTPMVHAKAQAVMRDIYRGRQDDVEDDFSSEYAEIAMDPMSSRHPGKTARFATDRATTKQKKDMFEVVPESRLDFSYFKDRSDFRDEYGGAADLISERSGTPVSFMSHSRGTSGDSPSSSRASSPGPVGGPGASGGYRTYASPHGPYSQSPSPSRTQSPRGTLLQQHNMYDSSSFRGSHGHMYHSSNESEHNLLSGAQPVATVGSAADDGEDQRRGRDRRRGGPSSGSGSGSPSASQQQQQQQQQGGGREVYGLDRWRTGGSGYVGVPGDEASGYGDEVDQGLGYDAYRGRR